jgi:hypothetical protein
MKRRRTLPLVISAISAMVLGVALPLAAGASPATAAGSVATPSVRLINPVDHTTLRIRPNNHYELNFRVFVASVGGPFELWGQRPTYADPVGLTQVVRDGSGDVVDSIPVADAPEPDMSRGVKSFFTVTLAKKNGTVIQSRSQSFCPESYDAQRLSDAAPTVTSYPSFCWGGPFSKGMVWGIDDGWAVPVSTWLGRRLNIDPGDYRLTVSVNQPYRDAFGVSDADASVSTAITAKARTTSSTVRQRRTASSETAPQNQSPANAPVITPPANTLPDIEALPAWGITVSNIHKSGKSYLNFGATAWNGGPGPLDVEGFRAAGSPTMDAFQYFYDGDNVVAKQPAGSLEYDSRKGHEHWHFRDFAAYSLLNADKQKVLDSGKEAFCLAPTDPIDLTAPGAVWNPWLTSLATACGQQDSLWIREVLETGWGDTYTQYRPGQSFDITDLPNGKYFIKVQTNPDGVLLETSTDNNVALRVVHIHGKPGARTVTVPPYMGIDTEHSGCGIFC